MNTKAFALGSLLVTVVGCTALSASPSTDVAANSEQETETGDEALTRRISGSYARSTASSPSCATVSRLKLEASGRFVATFAPSNAASLRCSAPAPVDVVGRWSSSGSRVVLRVGRAVVARANHSAGALAFTRGTPLYLGMLAKLSGTECVDTRDCSAGLECASVVGHAFGECTAPPLNCASGGSCASDEQCLMALQPCRADAPCTPVGVCVKRPTDCFNGGMCAAGERCEPTVGACPADGECPLTGICVPTANCATGAECATGLHCAISVPLCTPGRPCEGPTGECVLD